MQRYRYTFINPPLVALPQEVNQVYESDFVGNYQVTVTADDGRVFLGVAKTWQQFQQLVNDVPAPNYALANDEEPPKRDHINPAHYKNLLEIYDGQGNHTDTIQWLEHLQYKPFWRNNMRAFVQAVLDLCADKYLSRMGMKDDERQEMQKVLWYTKFATAIMMNDFKPVRVNNIPVILKEGVTPELTALRKMAKLVQRGPEMDEVLIEGGVTPQEIALIRSSNG